MRRIFTWPRAVFLFIAAVLLAAWWVPSLNAERYREPIHTALENALDRKVKLGTIQFRLLPMPGFTIKDVTIGEDSAIGPEPIAYVTTMRARPTFAALFGGRLAFASVDLEDTSVNLTRVAKGDQEVQWNFSALMKPKLLATFPSVHMIGGRVNFKFGDTKSIFYLLNTDVDLWPPDSEEGPWTVKIRAEPARTDRPSRGFASFTARGQWEPKGNTITLDAKLEKSELGDMVTLFQGYESNLQGHIAGTAHLAGPMKQVGVAGRLTVDEIHGWNQTPPGGVAWPLAIGGVIDVPGQKLELRATLAGQKSTPLDVRYHAADYLRHPRWGVDALFTALPVAPFAAVARNLGSNIPPEMTIEGSLDGKVSYESSDGLGKTNGSMRIVNSAVMFPDAPPLKLSPVELSFEDFTMNTLPVTISNDKGETSVIDGTWNSSAGTVGMSVASDGMSIDSFRRQAGVFGIPLLDKAVSGKWSGSLEYAGQKEGWNGKAHLTDAVLSFEAFSEPLRIASGDVLIAGRAFSMQGVSFTVGDVQGQGDYRFDPEAPRQHLFRLMLNKATGEEMESLLTPALHRGSFLNYAFNFGRVPEPGWMQGMHADGTIQAASLPMGKLLFSRVKTRVVWDGGEVRFSQLEGNMGEASFAGVGTADLSQRQPTYSLSGKLSGFDWKHGTVSAEGTLETNGTGTGLLDNISAKGSFRARRVAPATPWDAVNACFELVRGGKLQLSQMVVTAGRESRVATADAPVNDAVAVHVDGKPEPVSIQLR